jgi:hypothetical protein
MYTKEYDPETGNWNILDPQGDVVVNVLEEDADILLSHLNR